MNFQEISHQELERLDLINSPQATKDLQPSFNSLPVDTSWTSLGLEDVS